MDPSIKPIKTGVKVVNYNLIVTFQIVQVAVDEEVRTELLSRIDRLSDWHSFPGRWTIEPKVLASVLQAVDRAKA